MPSAQDAPITDLFAVRDGIAPAVMAPAGATADSSAAASETPGPSRGTSTSEYRSAGRAPGSVRARTPRTRQSAASAPVHHDFTPCTRTEPSARRSPRAVSERGSDEATPGSVIQ